jgi:hypothetical protein
MMARASMCTDSVDRIAIILIKSTLVDCNATIIATPAAVAVADVKINVIHTSACTEASRQGRAWATARL